MASAGIDHDPAACAAGRSLRCGPNTGAADIDALQDHGVPSCARRRGTAGLAKGAGRRKARSISSRAVTRSTWVYLVVCRRGRTGRPRGSSSIELSACTSRRACRIDPVREESLVVRPDRRWSAVLGRNRARGIARIGQMVSGETSSRHETFVTPVHVGSKTSTANVVGGPDDERSGTINALG